MFDRLLKPWFIRHPSQLLVRAVHTVRKPKPGFQSLKTAWGVTLSADPTKTIGQSILTTGVYEIAVSELLARLIQPGDTVIDAGANIGYTTLLSAVRAGERGTVYSFEPHPQLFGILEQNVREAGKTRRLADVRLSQSALGAEPGEARLVVPDWFSDNDGVAFISLEQVERRQTASVTVTTVDTVLGSGAASMLKVDVEGFELPVLHGARAALESRRIKHVLFESHKRREDPVIQFLLELGYTVYSVGWTLSGPRIATLDQADAFSAYEPPNYLASIAPDEVTARCASKGWVVLGNLAPVARD